MRTPELLTWACSELPDHSQSSTSNLVVGLVLTDRALLQDGELDALATGQGHKRARLVADHEDVTKTGGEVVASRILDVGNVERTLVSVASRENNEYASAMTSPGESSSPPGQQ